MRRLRSTEGNQRGGFVGVHVAPDSSAEVPDSDGVRLVILAPTLRHSRVDTDSLAMGFVQETWLDVVGDTARSYIGQV